MGGFIVNQRIPLREDQKVFFANSIFRAVTQDLPELIDENNLPTNVGSGLFRWNFINRNLSAASNDDFELSFPKRGAWKFILLREKNTGLSFSVMTEQNLKRLQSNPSFQAHYLEALVSGNVIRDPIEGQRYFVDLFPERDAVFLSNLRNQLLSGFSGTVEEHVLVLFDYNDIGVTSARAVLLTSSLEITVSENWTQYLTSTYVPKTSIFTTALSDEDEPLVKLKPNPDSEPISLVELPKLQTEKEAK